MEHHVNVFCCNKSIILLFYLFYFLLNARIQNEFSPFRVLIICSTLFTSQYRLQFPAHPPTDSIVKQTGLRENVFIYGIYV